MKSVIFKTTAHIVIGIMLLFLYICFSEDIMNRAEVLSGH